MPTEAVGLRPALSGAEMIVMSAPKPHRGNPGCDQIRSREKSQSRLA